MLGEVREDAALADERVHALRSIAFEVVAPTRVDIQMGRELTPNLGQLAVRQ
jgi:hypothetical protein